MIKWPLPKKVRLFEVGPRDGLQNEPGVISVEQKLAYIEALVDAGLKDIEVGAFVREDRIPQMANTDKLFKILHEKKYFDRKGLTLWTLVPNEKGLDRALQSECRAIAVFTGATDTFTRNNIGMNVKDSLKVFEKITERAHKEKIRVRGYVSVCWGCPYEGKVSASKVVKLARNLLDMGIEQVSLGDTIGVANPMEVVKLLLSLRKEISQDLIAGHFHDTRGTALPNCLAAVGFGVRTLDSSSGGLGGCNYAPGASGNVATEELVYMLEGMKISTGIDLESLCRASEIAISGLGKISSSRYFQAWKAKRI